MMKNPEGSSRQIGIYSPERSIVDMFRLRGSEGYELGVEALRSWLNRTKGTTPERCDPSTSFPAQANRCELPWST